MTDYNIWYLDFNENLIRSFDNHNYFGEIMTSEIQTDDSWKCSQCGFENELSENECFDCGAINKKKVRIENIESVNGSNSMKSDSENTRTQTMNTKNVVHTPIKWFLIILGYIFGFCIGLYIFMVADKYFFKSELINMGVKFIGFCMWIGVGRFIKSLVNKAFLREL